MRYNKVAVGGTFDRLHSGHRALLDKALELGGKVLVGLTSDARSKGAAGYRVRKKALEKHLEGRNYSIVRLDDDYGPAVSDREIEALVVSEETAPRAREINDIRRERGLEPLKIVVVPMVMAANGRRISSARIRRGEIDTEGRML